MIIEIDLEKMTSGGERNVVAVDREAYVKRLLIAGFAASSS